MGSVLRPDVTTLPHPLRRVMSLPEDLEQLLVRDHLRVEHDEHDFGVAGHPAANFLVSSVGSIASSVADGGRVDALQLPKNLLGSPETSQREHRHLHSFGKGRLQRMPIYEMGLGNRHGLGPPQKCVFLLRHLSFLDEHGRLLE